MEKALSDKARGPSTAPATARRRAEAIDWRRRMSDHVAYALLVYTGVQIFVTMQALKSGQGSILPYFALIVLVAAIIPACRWFEKRWETIGEERASDPSLAPAFHRDLWALWLSAIGLPLLITAGFKGITALI